GEAHGRIDADAVAGVDARAFHVLHYAGDKDVHTVAHRVHLALPAGNVAVHEHGLLFVYPDGLAEIAAEGGLVRDYLHGPADEDGVADFRGGADAGLYVRHRAALRLRDVQLLEQLFKEVAVFRALDGLAVRAYQLHAALHERRGEVYRRLPAECGDDAEGLF